MPSTLRSCSLFRGLDDSAFGLIEAVAVIRDFAKGERIFQQGAPCPGLFVVDRGLVHVYQLGPQGKRHVLHFAEPGRSFAEVAALGGFPCPASAEAAESSRCLLIPRSDLEALLDEHHALCRQLLSGMAQWVRSFVDLLEDVVLRDATARVAKALLDLNSGDGTIRLPMRRQDLASHLNLTSETFSRTLRRLGQRGLIESGAGSRIRIRDIDALERAAE